jgi:hypothetical protein
MEKVFPAVPLDETETREKNNHTVVRNIPLLGKPHPMGQNILQNQPPQRSTLHDRIRQNHRR